MKYLITLLAMVCVLLASCGSGNDITDDISGGDNSENPTPEEITDNYVYKLPVIFHVLYDNASDPTQHVSADRLRAILKNVNDLWRGGMYGSSVNINVEFELATTDEGGKKLSTPGVEYVKWDGTYPIDEYELMGNNTRKYVKYIWDPNKFINVMVYNFKNDEQTDGTVLGISHIPYTIKGATALEGLDSVTTNTINKSQLQFAYCSSINSTYINDESTRYTDIYKGSKGYTYYPTDINVTLAHELGHYLGLFHCFAEDRTATGTEYADDCFDSDYCDDTPSYNRLEYENFLTNYILQHQNDGNLSMADLIKRNNCDGQTFTATNIMDYSIDESYNFTTNQRERIRNVLYYSPLIPGAKKTVTTRTTASEEFINLPIRYIKCSIK